MNQWLRMELSAGTTVVPAFGECAALFLIPRRRTLARMCDIGRTYPPQGSAVPFWDSAFGIESPIDGLSLPDILRDYAVYFAPVPPLADGRSPFAVSDSRNQRKTGG